MSIDLYQGQDPRDLPAYTLRDAAHYLHVPVSTLRTWVAGRPYPVHGGEEWSAALIVPPPGRRLALSFTNLVEAHVLAATRRAHGIPLQAIRSSLRYVQEKLGVPRPLADVTFETNGVDLFVEHLGTLVNVSRAGQVVARELHASLQRIERDELRLAQRLFLFTREGRPMDQQPRVVVVDPRRAFGKPLIDETGIPTAVLRQRHRAGESLAEMAADYRCDPALIEEGLRCELRDAA